MSALLPLFSSPQNGLKAIGASDLSGAQSSVQEGHDHTSTSGEASSSVFSQVLRSQNARGTLPAHLQATTSLSTQENATRQVSVPQGDFRLGEIVAHFHSIEKNFRESQTDTPQPFQDVSILRSTDSDALPDTASLLTSIVLDASTVATHETSPGRAQNSVLAQASLPAAIHTVSLTPSTEAQAAGNEGLPGRTLLPLGGEPTRAPVRQDSEIAGHVSRNSHISLPNVPQSGLVPQQVSQSPDGKAGYSRVNQEEAVLPRTSASLVKDVQSGLSQIGRIAQEGDALKFPTLERFSNTAIRSQVLRPNDLLPVTAAPPEGPTGFTQTGPTSPLGGKPILGISSVLNDGSSPILENRETVQVDPHADRGFLTKGDRAHTMVEASLKHVGVDPSGGQELGNGMNHSPHSQSRFLEPSAFSNQGVGVRGVERGLELPTPALQRLQMDVQVSETQRVSIDVGVQNRLVSAGLVMDHSILRNLAAQFVPQLENQLSQVDLELTEFSAEVREEREPEAETLFDGSGSHGAQESRRGVTSETPSTHKTVV